MVNVTRRPVLQVAIDGQPAARVMSARVSKGLTQNYTTADVVLAYPYPTGLRQWSGITVRAGGDASSANFGVHFAGHVLDPSLAMWTPRGTISCGTALARAENYFPPISNTLNGLTDVEAIELILNAVGLYDRSIEGHGKQLGTFETSALTWGPSTSALSMLQQIDQQLGLGYRTFDTGTTIIRKLVPLSPNGMTPSYAFEEGVNCFGATLRRQRMEPAGRVVVNGDGVSSDQEASNPPRNYTITPYVVQYLMVQQQALDAGIVSAEEIGLYLLAKLTRTLVTVSLSTWVDDPISPGQIVSFKSAHLLVEQVFYVQQVVLSFEGARFRQQIDLISELDERTTPSGYQPFGSLDPGTMDPLDPYEPLDPLEFPPLEPIPIDDPAAVAAALTIMAIDQETVVIAGSETTVYIVYAVDASVAYQGTIATRAWTASGPVVSGWESGSGPEFVTAFTSRTAAVITLVATTDGGATGTATRDLGASPSVVTKTLELFLAAGVQAEAWSPSGTAWNVDAQSAAADVEDVANGPLWTLPTASVNAMWSTDYLATSATEETIGFSGGATAGVRAWIEPDVDDQAVAVIGSNGELALSTDGGDTWTIKAGPGGNGMDVILSRFVPGQIHVLTTTGWHVSDDGGNTWRTIRADTDFKWLTLSHTRNMITTTGGGLESAETGAAQTGPSGVVCAAAHIREDRFVALTSDGHVWRTEDDGGTVMEDLGTITGTPTHMYRHGSIPDFYVYTAGTAGAFKLLIRTNAGAAYDVQILQIRDPGVGTSHASSAYSRVGVGRMVDPGGAAGAGRLYAAGFEALYRSTDGGVTWTELQTFTAQATLTHPFDVLAGAAADGSQDVIVAADRSSTSPGWTAQLQVSTDGGASWSTHAPGTVSAGGVIRNVGVVSSTTWVFNTESLAGENTTNLHRTTNSGGSYTQTASGGHPMDGLQLADSGKIWGQFGGASGYGPTRFNDDLTGQEELEVSATDYNRVRAISATAAIYFSTQGGGTSNRTFALATDSGGLVWSGNIPPTGGGSLWDSDEPIMSAWSPDDGATIFAVLSDGSTQGQLWKRTSGTWTKIHDSATLGVTVPDYGLVGNPSDPTHLWLVSGNVVYRSTDGGVTWDTATISGATGLSQIQVAGA